MDNILEGSNTFGSNGLKWWIGQVADRSVWADSALLNNDVDDGRADYGGDAEVYYNRVKVRVVGYHDRLAEEDLPWAHIAATPMLASGYGMKYHTHYLEGGESVLGFWIDGTDEQKPVITAVFYNHKHARKDQTPLLKDGSDEWIQHNKPPLEVLNSGSNDGVLLASSTLLPGSYKKQNIVQDEISGRLLAKTPNKQCLNEASKPDTCSNASLIADKLKDKKTTKPTCKGEDASFSIAGAINDFTKLLLDIEAYNEFYVDAATGLLVNLDGEINLIAKKIGSVMAGMTKKIRSEIFSAIEKQIKNFTNSKVISELKLPFSEGIKNVSDSIYCLFENILGGLTDTIGKFLKTLIGKIVNAPICAAEQFMGALLNDITKNITNTISPILTSLTSTLGGALGSVNSLIGSALQGLGILSKLIQCNDFKCPPPSRFDLNVGPSQGERKKVDKILSKTSIISDGIDNLGLPSIFDTPDPEPGSIAALAGECESNVLRCGPPIVEFFGGTPGVGGFGNAVVNNIGQIIGVDLISRGLGFTKENPPYVSFRDSCGDGEGAAGTVVIGDDGGIDSVIMDYPGYNYNSTFGRIITPSGIIESNQPDTDGTSVTGQIDRIIVNNTGFGYNNGDTIDLDGVILEPVILGGHVVSVNVLDGGTGFTTIPNIIVNSDTGIGANLQVVLKFTNINEISQKLDPDKIIQVVDCVEKPLTRNVIGA